MKRVCSLICLLFLMLAMVLPVNAEETAKSEDSVTIPEDVLACLDIETVDTVFRVYDITDGYAGFVTYGDIDGVLANTTEPQLRIYYFVKNKQGETASYTYDGTRLSKTQYHSGWGSGWYNVHSERAIAVIKQITEDIVVENIYYLWYENWSAVYYKTNLGDYVYVRAGKEYLMGLDQFLALQSELHDQWIKFKDWRDMDNMPAQIKISELRVDLSPYDITSPDFDPYAPLKTNFKPGKFIAIGSFVLFIALVVGRFLIRGHGKYREKKERMSSRI